MPRKLNPSLGAGPGWGAGGRPSVINTAAEGVQSVRAPVRRKECPAVAARTAGWAKSHQERRRRRAKWGA